MDWPPVAYHSGKEGASAAFVCRIILKQLAVRQTFQDVIQCEVLGHHFLMGMNGEANLTSSNLLNDASLDFPDL